MEKIKSIGRIITALVLSFLIAQISSNIFFENNNSSTLRSNPQEYLATYFKQTSNSLIAFITNTTNNKAVAPITQNTQEIAKIMEERKQELQYAPLTQIAKGIKAQENSTTSITTITTGEVETITYTFNVDGKKVVVSIPKIYYDKFGLSEQKIKESIMKNR